MAGNGTAADPYAITNVEELQAMTENVSAHYVLEGDLRASETSTWEGGAGFDPIGSDDTFVGTFDGQGHTIVDLKIDRPSDDDVGLFSSTHDGVVEDLHLENVSITGGDTVGGLVGMNGGTISNVSLSGTVRGTDDMVGGLTGANHGSIQRSSVTGTVTGTEDTVGGLVGLNTGPVDRSFTYVHVSGVEAIGGLVGINDGPVRATFAAGDVAGESLSGGLVGTNAEAMNDVYATTSVTGDEFVGGLIGLNEGTVTGAYASGRILAGTGGGGLVGIEEGIVTDAYWDIDETGTETPYAFDETSHRGHETVVTGLASYELTGESVHETTKLDLSASGAWRTTDTYPRFDWETTRDIDEELYALSVDTSEPEPNESVTEEPAGNDVDGENDRWFDVFGIGGFAAVAVGLILVAGSSVFVWYQWNRTPSGDDR